MGRPPPAIPEFWRVSRRELKASIFPSLSQGASLGGGLSRQFWSWPRLCASGSLGSGVGVEFGPLGLNRASCATTPRGPLRLTLVRRADRGPSGRKRIAGREGLFDCLIEPPFLLLVPIARSGRLFGVVFHVGGSVFGPSENARPADRKYDGRPQSRYVHDHSVKHQRVCPHPFSDVRRFAFDGRLQKCIVEPCKRPSAAPRSFQSGSLDRCRATSASKT